MREPLPTRPPAAGAVTLRDLAGIAHAIGQEAARRYGQLADLMERRDEQDASDALRAMQREELAHVSSVAQWAEQLDEAVPPADEFEWQLPPEVAASWDDIATTLLTPYRAFSIAVRNKERAFTLYIHLSAHAADARVARKADKLAGEELDHAALLRRWRRAAYHKGRCSRRAACRPRITTLEDLHAHLNEREAGIAGCHRALAARLHDLGDNESAALLEALLDEPSRTPAPAAVNCGDTDCRSSNPVQLLAAAQKPFERLSEELADVLEAADAELFAAAEQALTNVVGRLARLVFHIERKLQDA